MKIVTIGDSLTTGFGVYEKDSWVKILSNSLNVEIENKAVNGATTSDMLFNSYEDILIAKADIVFIMGGCNDLLNNLPTHRVFSNLKLLCEECSKNGIKIVLGIEPPIIEDIAIAFWSSFPNYKEVNSNLADLREKIIEYCIEKKILYIDFYKLINNLLADYTPKQLYKDGVHLSIRGNKFLANEAFNLFKKL